MNSRTYFFIALLACVGGIHSQTIVNPETIRPIVEAANQPFTEFAAVLQSTRLPGLPLPTAKSVDQNLSAVSQLLWGQLSSVDILVTVENKTSVLSTMKAMIGIRAWLLEGRSYANLLFAAQIEENVCLSSLSALADGLITVDEARDILRRLGKPIQVNEVVQVIEGIVPNSKLVAQMKKDGIGSLSLFGLSNRLAEELPELVDTRKAKLMEGERPASIVFYIGLASTTTRFSSVLVELAAKGGQLTRPASELTEQIKRLSPEAIGKIDQSSGLEINASMLAGLMYNVRKWKAKQLSSHSRQ